jgi:predicted molibdopterin-dependent oxidoreductase YjgC
MYAEKAPNARGVRRVLKALSGGKAIEFDALLTALSRDGIDAILITGNYPSDWVTPQLLAALDTARHRFIALIDTLPTQMGDRADVLIPGATWTEKAGTFENANGRLQAFERAIAPLDFCKSEAQIALDLSASCDGYAPVTYDAAAVRRTMAEAGMPEFMEQVHLPREHLEVRADMQLVEL